MIKKKKKKKYHLCLAGVKEVRENETEKKEGASNETGSVVSLLSPLVNAISIEKRSGN